MLCDGDISNRIVLKHYLHENIIEQGLQKTDFQVTGFDPNDFLSGLREKLCIRCQNHEPG